MITDLTVGKPRRVLWAYCAPLFISVIFQQMYNLADSVIAGNFSQNGEMALAAVGASAPITMIFVAIANGCNIGCSVVIARLFGNHEIGRMKTAVSTTILSSVALAGVLIAAGTLFCDPLMRLMNTPADIFEQAALYLRIYIFGFAFLFLYNVATGIFSALGDSKTPLYFLIGSSLGNILLDYLFVAYFHWDVAGVAWATFLAQGIACILALFALILRLKKVGETTVKTPAFSTPLFKSIFAISLPSVLQQSFISVGNLFVQAKINSYGAPVIAGASAALKVNIIAIAAFATFSGGLSNFTSQNLGAGKKERIKQGFFAAIIICLILSVLLTAAFVLGGRQLIGLFMEQSDNSTLALDTGYGFLAVVSPFYVVVSVKLIADGILRGLSRMKAFMIATFTDLILRVALCFALYNPTSPFAMWFSWPVGWTVAMLLSLYYMYRIFKELKDPSAKPIS